MRQQLKPIEQDELILWIAQGKKYSELCRLMLDRWGFSISSPSCTYYRQHFSARIANIQARLDCDGQRRQHERLARRKRTIAGRQCPHCGQALPNGAA